MANRGRKRKTQSAASAAPELASAPESAEQPEGQPVAASARGRTLATGFIALFLLYQVAMPLTYYLGGRGSDERFSWRMFSSVRMQKCKARVDETVGGEQRAVDLDREVQVAWHGMLDRYRPAVVEKLLRRRCERAQASETRYERRCTGTDGNPLPATTVTLDCARDMFVTAEGGAKAAAGSGKGTGKGTLGSGE